MCVYMIYFYYWNWIFLTVGDSLLPPPSSSFFLQVPRKPVKGLTDGATYTPVEGELEEEMTCLPKVPKQPINTSINNILIYINNPMTDLLKVHYSHPIVCVV